MRVLESCEKSNALKDEWYIDMQAYKLIIFEIRILIDCVSTLFLCIVSTDPIICRG